MSNIFYIKGQTPYAVDKQCDKLIREIAKSCRGDDSVTLRFEFNKATEKGDRILLTTITTESDLAMNDEHGLDPTGPVLVDSDRFSFIYVMDNGDELVHASLQESVWPLLRKALDEELAVEVKLNGTAVELKDLHEELAYLIDNIEGNPNYGNDLVDKVEQHFLNRKT